jgi:hypothetical protein
MRSAPGCRDGSSGGGIEVVQALHVHREGHETLRRINRELEDASTRLYAMAVRGTKEARER